MDLPETPAPHLFAELAAKHGHYCPMSTLGLRIGWAAQRKFKGELQDATYLAQTCAVDGIRLAFDGGTLQVEEGGRHLLRFADQDHGWKIELRPETLRLAASYRLLDNEGERERLLDRLRCADEISLFFIEPDGVCA